MSLTTTEIKEISDKYLDLWFADVDKNERGSLRDHVEQAISEALAKQAALFNSANRQ